jgi:hypothetical protein
MTKEEAINTIIAGGCETNKISDGYHTFGELYDHRIRLFIALCRIIRDNLQLQADGLGVWRSQFHSDGSNYDGWFIMGIYTGYGFQISYHLPMEEWKWTEFARTLDRAPEWDGHTPNDVLERLRSL